MRVEHYVLLAAPKEKAAELESALERFVDEIGALDSVIEVTTGANFNPGGADRGWSHGMLVRFTDRDALPRYQEHEAHLRLVAVLNEVCTDRLALDYELKEEGEPT